MAFSVANAVFVSAFYGQPHTAGGYEFIVSEISKIPPEILRFAAALSFLNEVKNPAAAHLRMTRVKLFI